MKSRRFGNTDLQVSEICLGSMQFGWTSDEAAAITVMDAFVASCADSEPAGTPWDHPSRW